MLNRFPSRRLLAGALLPAVLAFAACDDDDEPVGPEPAPDIAVSPQAHDFGDVELDASEEQGFTVTNGGDAALTVSAVTLTGDNAGDFSLGDSPTNFTVAAGGTQDVTVTFTPSAAGERSAVLSIASDDEDSPTVDVELTGTGIVTEEPAVTFTQVDRIGIPGLNTVFNHPTSVEGFSKVDYNVAGPADDVDTYTDQFVTVLEAVGNADPTASAGLLLPDELPVSLGAQTTSFAMLNGRALADDAVDVALGVTVGEESLQSDNVDSNDAEFLAEFPYLAPPNTN